MSTVEWRVYASIRVGGPVAKEVVFGVITSNHTFLPKVQDAYTAIAESEGLEPGEVVIIDAVVLSTCPVQVLANQASEERVDIPLVYDQRSGRVLTRQEADE